MIQNVIVYVVLLASQMVIPNRSGCFKKGPLVGYSAYPMEGTHSIKLCVTRDMTASGIEGKQHGFLHSSGALRQG